MKRNYMPILRITSKPDINQVSYYFDCTTKEAIPNRCDMPAYHRPRWNSLFCYRLFHFNKTLIKNFDHFIYILLCYNQWWHKADDIRPGSN